MPPRSVALAIVVFWLAMTVVWFRWAASENADLEAAFVTPPLPSPPTDAS